MRKIKKLDDKTIRITMPKQMDDYTFEELSSSVATREFLLRKQDGTPYCVKVTKYGVSCTCKGYQRWLHCKHADGLKAMIERGVL